MLTAWFCEAAVAIQLAPKSANEFGYATMAEAHGKLGGHKTNEVVNALAVKWKGHYAVLFRDEGRELATMLSSD